MNKILLILLSMVLILSGCTQQQVNEPAKITTSLDKGVVRVIREDEGPAQGGILNLFMVKPDTLNPLTSQNATVRQLSAFVFDSLFLEEEDGTLINSLADDYAFSQDGLILDITLRDDILFHDEQPLTADDVAFSLETIRTANKRSLYGNHVSNIETVKVINRLSLRLILRTPDTTLPDKLTFPIIPRHVFQDWPIEGHDSTMKLIGTGAFKFDSYEGEVLSLLRNDSWWYLKVPDGLSHPIWLDGITFKVFSNVSEMMQAFQKQDIDIAYLDESGLESYEKRADIFLNRYESNALEFLAFSPVGREGSPIKQEAFRASMIQYLSQYALLNPLPIGKSAIPLSGETSHENQAASGNRINRESTLEALAAIGFTYEEDDNRLIFVKNGSKIHVSLSLKYNGQNPDRQTVSEWITSALFEIGINVTPESTSYSDEQALIKNGKFDMMLLGCRMPLFTDMAGSLELVKRTLGMDEHNGVLLPLYRKYGAVLYHNSIRGPRSPSWKNLYNGWMDWYLVKSPE